MFGKKEDQSSISNDTITIGEFWDWFEANQLSFFNAVKKKNNIQVEFINPVFNKLNQIKEGAFFLTGMKDEMTAELVFTAEGNLLNFPFINEIVDAAPNLNNWQFTAFKPSMESPDFGIKMGPKSFSTMNVIFFPEIDPDFPDQINIKLVYTDEYGQEERELVENGSFIFVENFLGELKMATQINRISVAHQIDEATELIPISKLSEYITWREKEFEEKYLGTVHNSDESNYAGLEWNQGDKAIIGTVNTDLIRWDKKASHPWIMVITINFDEYENNGMPNQNSLQSYYQFEEKLRNLLPDKEGYVHVAQTTGLGKREIYFANKDYIKPIKVLENMKKQVDFQYDIEVFKDKYWQSMEHLEH